MKTNRGVHLFLSKERGYMSDMGLPNDTRKVRTKVCAAPLVAHVKSAKTSEVTQLTGKFSATALAPTAEALQSKANLKVDSTAKRFTPRVSTLNTDAQSGLESEVFAASILVVDDNEVNALLFVQIMQCAGYWNVRAETKPDKVVERIRSLKPDLVALDLHMPGVSGLKIMEILAAEEGPDFEAPLLVLTADTSRETRRQALELGAADFLTKPIDVTELCIRARNLLSIYFLRRHLEKQNSVLQETVDARTAELERTNRSLEVEMSVRKEADTLLRLAEQRLRFLMTSSPSTIYSANIKPPHHITFISENVHALLGYRADAFRSNPALWQEIAHPDDLARLWSDLPAKLATGSCSVEIRLMHKDKSYRWIQSDVAVTHDSNGLPSELVGSWTDITDRKATEAALAKTAVEVSSANAQLLEFDRLKSEFVSTASHEMRTPLTVIREFAMLLTDGAVASDVEEQAECFEAILRNCDRLTGMLDYLLDFQRIESGKLRLQRRKVNIQDVMSRSHKDLLPKCMAKKITFDLVLSGQSLLVIADEEQIVQVLVNLISNAVKFTPEHGTITLKVVNSDGFVHVSIEDTGRGIAPENLECVFEAFRQIDRVDGPGFQGTGLGLTISNRIVDMHGGALSVESTVDKGTVFTFTLPLWSESEALQAYMHDKGDDTEDQLFLLLVTPSPKKGQVDYPDEKTLGLLANGLKLTLRSHDNGLILPNIGCVAVAIENNRAGTEATVERLHIALPAVLPQNMTLKYDIIDLSKSDYAQVYAQYVHKDEEPLLGKADAGANTAN